MQARLYPYRSEKVVGGDGFNFASFLAFLTFCGVILLWLSTFLPTIKNALSFFNIFHSGSPTPTPAAEVHNVDVGSVMVVPTLFPTFTSTPTVEYSLTPTQEYSISAAEEIQLSLTPTLTFTPVPEITQTPGIIPFLSPLPPAGSWVARNFSEGLGIKVKLSYYWPPFGGINCDVIDGKEECNHIANGDYYYNWVGVGVACPAEFPFMSEIQINDLRFVCVDRGGAIVKDSDGSYWIDILYPYMPNGWYWSQVVDAVLYLEKVK